MTKLAQLLVVAGALGACDRGPAMFHEAKGDTAKVRARKYALEAYPQWAAVHFDKECPDTLEDLNEFMNTKDIRDPWGTPFTMLCGPTRPPRARGMVVRSAGPDMKAGTADDISSE